MNPGTAGSATGGAPETERLHLAGRGQRIERPLHGALAGAEREARAELDHDSPSARKANTTACSSSTGRASATIRRARRGTSASHWSSPARRPAAAGPCAAGRLRRAAARDAIRRRPSAERAGDERLSGHVAGPRFRQGRASATAPGASRATPPCAPDARRGGTRPRRARSRPSSASTSSRRSGAPRRSPGGAPPARPAAVRCRLPPSGPGCVPAPPPAGPDGAPRAPPRPGCVASRSLRRQLVRGPRRRRERRRIELGERALGFVQAPDQQQAPDAEIRACAALTRSPCASSVSRAASSAFAGQPRSREARRDLRFGDDAARARPPPPSRRRHGPRAARAPSPAPDRRAARARCHASASAGASSRSATRFNAPRGSPAASAPRP